MTLKEKEIKVGKNNLKVTLEKNGSMYTIMIGKEVEYKSPNEMFATQRFNSI